MKLSITGASNFVNRMFEACGNYQWAREFVKNSIEAGARRVEFGVEWQAVEKYGCYRRTIMDDGLGMDRDELLRFFSTLGVGAKKIGGIHENFGVGAKIASLPWNPEGIVVISYKNGVGAMIWITLDSRSGDYQLVEFDTGRGKACVIEPQALENDIDWSMVRETAAINNSIIDKHGTVVVLLGSADAPDTILGNPHSAEQDIKGLAVYLNSRFWAFDNVDVTVVEPRTSRRTQWPKQRIDEDPTHRFNNRSVKGACYYLTHVEADGGALAAHGTVPLEKGRVAANWYLWSGDRPAIHSYARRNGYVAVRYKGELFEMTSHKVPYRAFGIVETKVQQNLTIILEPQHYQSGGEGWGIHPDQSRNRLLFSGDDIRGAVIPIVDWGVEFASNMPEEIWEAIRDARSGTTGSISDEYRQRLQDKFGDRWKTKTFVEAKPKEGAEEESQDDLTPAGEVEIYEHIHNTKQARKGTKSNRSYKLLRSRMLPGGIETGVERELPVDVPQYRPARADAFERKWHLAAWVPNDPSGPTVLINFDSPILQEIVLYHQNQYPDVYAEEVQQVVHQVFGEVATCKIAHSQKLASELPEEEIDKYYRSEQALTVALMGLIAEESVISSRLIKLGRSRRRHEAA